VPSRPVAALLGALAAIGLSAAPAAAQRTDADAAPSTPAAAPPSTPEQELAERYAPVVAVRTQTERCGPGEPYAPIAVDALWRRPDVVLRGPGGARIEAPDDTDLAGRGDGWYLDLPGNALRPGCDYERFADRLGADPTVYARVAPDGEGGLALQYWLFYVYNDWNDRHEGDWEMIQLLFDAADAQAALATSPDVVAFAQHEGAELADWGAPPLQVVDGTHPVVHPGEGSHASYFRSDQWFGKSAQSGFGCDDTSAPLTELRPQVLLLDATAPPAWLSYTGRWGEQQPSFNNGPTGPNTKDQWASPRRWVDDEGRRGAVALPAGGSQVTDAFCAITSAGSLLMFRALDQPAVVAGAIAVVLAALVALIRRTRWSPVVLPPSAEPRSGGQILRTAWRIVRREPLRFARLGLLLPIAGAVASMLQAVLRSATGFGALQGVLGEESVFGGLLASTIGLAVLAPAAAVASVASMHAVRTPHGERPSSRVLVRQAIQQRRAIGVHLVTATVVGLGLLTFVLFPVVLWWHARVCVAVPSALDDPAPFARSSSLTAGHRLRALGITWVAVGIGAAVPLAVGLGVLLVTDASFTTVNLIAGVAGLLTVPLAAAVAELQYQDLCARAALATTSEASPAADGLALR
jgi:hypothetical protein